MAAIQMRMGPGARTVSLLIVLVVAAGLRFTGRNWDAGQYLHPDERFLAMVVAAERWPDSLRTYLDESRSPLNPRNVGFSFFAYGTLPTTVVKAVGVALDRGDIQELTLLGRSASAAASVGSVLLIFLIARRLYGDDRIASLAALLLATAVLPVQHAHFFVVDPFVTFFITATVWALAGPPRPYRYPLAGFLFGLAVACKLSVASFAAVIGVVALSEAFAPSSSRVSLPGARRILFAAARVVMAMAAALVALRLAQPDSFQGPGLLDVMPSARWLDNFATSLQLVSGAVDVPYGTQWANRTPYWFPWQNLVLWGLGPTLGLAASAGWAVATWQLVVRRRRQHLIPTLWTAIVFVHLGGQFVTTARYFLPIYPMLVLLAAWLLVTLWDRSAARHTAGRWPRVAAGGLALLVVLTTGLWAAAFTAIYRRPNTRIDASRWIYRNVPRDATVGIEHWDDVLPLRLDGRSPDDYATVILTLYDNDTPEKLDTLVDQLDDIDYLILASNRLYDSIPRLPMRYPMTVRYYDALFSGSLGFERAADFTSFPSIGGLRIADQSAEEAFTVYDHARVQIFRKTPRWNPARARSQLGQVDWSAIVPLRAAQARAFGSGQMLSPADRLAVRDAGTWSRIFSPHDVANTWPIAVWVLALELLGLVAFPLAALALGSLPDRGWLLAKSVGLLLLGYAAWLPASLRWFPFTRAALAAIILAMAVASALLLWRRSNEYRRFWDERWSLLVWEECLFWICFAAFLVVRSGNPDLWHPYFGGEKPMDFAYLNAVVKSEHFPPYDPWFAGGHLNYYYFGFVLVGALVKLTGIVPEVSYNLAIATLFAMTAAATFSVVHALVWTLGAARRADSDPKPSGAFAFAHGLVGIVFVAVLGNLVEVRLLSKALLERSWSREPVWTWFWTATRAIPAAAGEAAPITEFPFFTFLYGDLHAHAMGLPFTILVLALVASSVLPSVPAGDTGPGSRAVWFGLLALTLGALFPLNAWDYPTYAFVVGAALALRAWLRRRPEQSLGSMLGGAAVLWAAVLGASRVLFWPFFAQYAQPYGTFRLWSGSHTSLAAYLAIHGLFLFVITTAALWLVSTRRVDGRPRTSATAAYGLAGILGGTALLLTLVVEFIVLAGDIGRMNTVFKFYFQAWVLFSVAAAVGLAVMARAWSNRPAAGPWWLDAPGYVWMGLVLCLIAGSVSYPVLATRARWLDRFGSDAGFTLDGEAFMRRAVHTESGTTFPLGPDLEAIGWLRTAVAGTPVIAEAHTPEYRWGSRVSVHTGLPTIVGWRTHQAQQRAVLPREVIDRRVADVEALYSTPDAAAARAVIDRYQVEYIYVGPLERILYPAEGLAKFDGDSPYWHRVYRQGGVSVYAVSH